MFRNLLIVGGGVVVGYLLASVAVSVATLVMESSLEDDALADL